MTNTVRKFMVYRSSAGSGKTHALVREFLRLSLSRNNPSAYTRLLAITFTNKTTAEMKERILKSLAAFAGIRQHNRKTSALLNDVLALTETDEKELAKRAKLLLQHLLHHYTEFSVSTIDKFILRIARSFARDLKLSYNFEVELDKEVLLAHAIDRTLEKVGTEEALTSLLTQFSIEKVEDEKRWKIDEAIMDVGKDLFKEGARPFIERNASLTLEQFSRIIATIRSSISSFENRMQELGSKALEVLEQAGIPAEQLAGGTKGIGAYFIKLKKKEQFIPNDTVLNAIAKGNWARSNVKKEMKGRIESVQDILEGIYRQTEDCLEKNWKPYMRYRIISRNIITLGVLSRIEENIRQLQEEYNLLHISEFNRRISGIVAKEPAPFIYERLGENYRHFLVDEFQDTSVLQWMNLLPLLHNGLSGGHESFVVGDAKQAIYRFRSGEVEQFIRLPKIKGASENPLLREREKCLEDNIGVDHLKYNYRSCREIVEFNNHLFGQLNDKLSGELKKVYADHKQEVRREGGYVSVEIISESADDPLPHLSRSLEIVQELIEDGFMQGEIAILVRSNNDGAEMACFLMEQGINVVSTDSLKLGSSQKAGCVIALLRVLSDAADAALRCAAITQLEKAGLLKMELHEAVARCMAGNELKGFESLLAESDMPFCISDLSSLPLTEQTESLIRLLGFARTPDPFLLGLLECVQEFSTRFNTGLHAFLDRWDSNYCKSNIALSASDDAVRVLTIHKAKGLEFPAVIIPKASWVKNTGKDRKWVSYRDDNLKELNSIAININKGLKETDFDAYFNEEVNLIELDNINLLYVACTRPSERLYVISKKAVGNNISGNIVPAIEKHPLWNKEDQRLLLGEKTMHAKQQDEDKSCTDTEIAEMPSAPWQGRIHFAAGRGEATPYCGEEKRKFGKLLHSALSHINTKEDAEKAIGLMYATAPALPDALKKAEETITAMMQDERIVAFFRSGVKVLNETELLMPGSEHLLRPDRIILDENSTEVVDFKTGRPHQAHKQQVKEYMNALQQAGHPQVKGYLIYTESMKVIQV